MLFIEAVSCVWRGDSIVEELQWSACQLLFSFVDDHMGPVPGNNEQKQNICLIERREGIVRGYANNNLLKRLLKVLCYSYPALLVLFFKKQKVIIHN